MGKDNSFDVVSKVDLNVISECVQVALKEITNRYDFRGSNTTIELDPKASELSLQSADDYKVNAAYDVLATLAVIAGADAPDDTDGTSFVPTLLSRQSRQKRPKYLFWD